MRNKKVVNTEELYHLVEYSETSICRHVARSLARGKEKTAKTQLFEFLRFWTVKKIFSMLKVF